MNCEAVQISATIKRMRAGIVAGSFLGAVVVAVALIPSTMSAGRLRRTDLACFYAAGSVFLQGQAHHLYDVKTLDPVLKQLQESNRVEVGEYCVHPPFEILLFALLALVPYKYAFATWAAFNVAIVSLLSVVLMPVIPLVRRSPQVWLLVFCFFPTVVTLTLAQDSILVLAAVCASYALLMRNRPFAAGLALALGAVKFQYAIPMIVLLAAARKWRMVAGACVAGLCLAVISLVVFGPAELTQYYYFVQKFAPLQYRGYMVNAHGLLYALGLASTAPAILIEVATLATGMLLAWLVGPEERSGLVFAAYIMIALLSAPYLHVADMTVAYLALVLVTDYAVARKNSRGKILLIATVLVFLAPIVLLIFGGHYWWNSRMYLMFPITFAYAVVLGKEILLNRKAAVAGSAYSHFSALS